MRVVVTLLRPEAAAYASSDGGASWTRASIPLDAPDADERARAAFVRPRLLAEVLFDARDGRRAWARARGRVFHTEDGGLTWAATPLAGIVALAQGVDGLLRAAGEGGVHVSDDGGRSWVHRPVQLPGAAADTRLRVGSLVLDDQRRGRVLLGVRDARNDAEPPAIATVLDGTSDAVQAALALVDATDAPPRALTAFGQGATGVIETRDGGASWRRTGLALDSLALTGMARAGAEFYAWAPTATHWDRLAEAALAASVMEGEISLGPGATPAGPGAFTLLRSTDGGASWAEVAQGPDAFDGTGHLRAQQGAPYPSWLAAGPREAFIGLAAGDHTGPPRRETWRDSF